MGREKVIKGLHQHCEGSMFDRCGECPYYEIDHEPFICRDMLLNDLNALLKEQEKEIDEISDEYLDLGNEIAKMPKVVLCKDCKFNGSWQKCPYSAWTGEDPNDDWYCAKGERAETYQKLDET